MSEEDLDDWDEECMNILLQVEEKTISSFSSSSQPLSQTTSLLPRPPESRRITVEYSPPRELSKRTLRDERELLVSGIKEQESSKPRKERNAKNEQRNNGSSSTSKGKDETQWRSNRPDLATEREDSNDRPDIPRKFKSTSCSKAIGVQTDDGGGSSSRVFICDETRACEDLSKKLLDIWDLPSAETLGRSLVSNLLVACETDLHELFGCMDTTLSMKPRSGSTLCGSSNGPSLHPQHLSLKASKVSHFYSILTKINNGMVRAEALLEPLLDLCALENVNVIHRSLRILNVFLKQLFSLERISGERDNIVVEGLSSGIDTGENLYEKQQWKSSAPNLVSHVDWVSLFEALLQIAEKETEELVRGEAISLMNIILIRSNAYTDREKFGHTRVFESIPQMLRKEAGLHVQKQSIQLIYLLLNCPKLLVLFGCGPAEEESTSVLNIDDDKILCSLADCMAFSVTGLKELELIRNVIVLLAFLASSGKSGFDILVGHKLPKDTNFLLLIMQSLASEIEIEAASLSKSPEIFKERALLMREALILLNRLVSNPNYSATALQILTKSRDMASLTINIANRLSRNDDHRNSHFGVVGTTRKTEVVELARIFKKRVFAYLGNHIS